jgi:hypothetical protein
MTVLKRLRTDGFREIFPSAGLAVTLLDRLVWRPGSPQAALGQTGRAPRKPRPATEVPGS